MIDKKKSETNTSLSIKEEKSLCGSGNFSSKKKKPFAKPVLVGHFGSFLQAAYFSQSLGIKAGTWNDSSAGQAEK